MYPAYSRKQISRKFLYGVTAISFVLFTAILFYALQGELSTLASMPLLLFATFLPFATLAQFRRSERVAYYCLSDEKIEILNKERARKIEIDTREITSFQIIFSAIVLHTTSNQELIMDLSMIRSEKSRWEIKEYFKSRFGQTTFQHHYPADVETDYVLEIA